MTESPTLRELVFDALTSADVVNPKYVRWEDVGTVAIDLIDYDSDVFNAIKADDLGAGDVAEHIEAWRKQQLEEKAS